MLTYSTMKRFSSPCSIGYAKIDVDLVVASRYLDGGAAQGLERQRARKSAAGPICLQIGCWVSA